EDGGPASGLLTGTGVPRVWAVRGWNGGGVKTAPEAGRLIAAALLADPGGAAHGTGPGDARPGGAGSTTCPGTGP
ncbi:hypothetical protein ACFXHD_41545, partial [Streptomyces hydrogenans]